MEDRDREVWVEGFVWKDESIDEWLSNFRTQPFGECLSVAA